MDPDAGTLRLRAAQAQQLAPLEVKEFERGKSDCGGVHVPLMSGIL